jgi:hypothetical protein
VISGAADASEQFVRHGKMARETVRENPDPEAQNENAPSRVSAQKSYRGERLREMVSRRHADADDLTDLLRRQSTGAERHLAQDL